MSLAKPCKRFLIWYLIHNATPLLEVNKDELVLTNI